MAHRLARSKGYEVEVRLRHEGASLPRTSRTACDFPGDGVLFPWCARRIEVPRDWRLGMLTMLGYAGRRGADIMLVCRCD